MLFKDLSDICKSGNAVSKTLASCFRLAECALALSLKACPRSLPNLDHKLAAPS